MKAEAHTPPLSNSPKTLHRAQCRAAERHSSGATSEAIGAWSGILRELLPRILRTDDAHSGRGEDKRGTFMDGARQSHDLPMVLWVAPVRHIPRTDDAIFGVFPYVLVYTKVEGGDGDGDSHDNTYDSHNEPCHHPLSASGSADSDSRRMGAGAAYNLGLAYHMQALQGPPEVRDASLATALRAYKAARDMLHSVDDCRRESSSHTSEDDRLLLLAIANNEGHVWEHWHDRSGTVEALRRLRALLEGATEPSGLCLHFAVTDSLFGDPHVVLHLHSAAA